MEVGNIHVKFVVIKIIKIMINKTTLSRNATLEEAKKFLRDNWDDGAICPACTQVVKLYKRPITSSMAYALILIYKYLESHPDMEWVHMNNYLNTIEGLPFPVKSGDNAKLRYWGLIEEMLEVRKDGSKRAGYWRVTELGKQFVNEEIGVQEYAKVFGSKCYGLAGEHVGIKDALGKKFNYKELMAL